MRYNYYHSDGRRSGIETELRITHVVIGQRNEEADRKRLSEAIAKPVEARSDKEKVDVRKFVQDSGDGWYKQKTIAWTGSLEEANTIADKFKADGWINVSVNEINPQHIITHA